MKLSLPTGEINEYTDFSKYKEDFYESLQKIVDQKIWVMRDTSQEERDLREEVIRLQYKLLFTQQQKKFNSGDEAAWDASMASLQEFARKENEIRTVLNPYIEKLLNQYNSQDPQEFKKGRLNYRLLLIEAFGNDSSIGEWDLKHLHGDIEIEQAFRNLYHNGTLEDFVKKLI